MREDPHKLLAENMRRFRQQHKWSQEKLGIEADLHRTYIGAVERLERNPSLASLGKIAAALGIETWQLLYPTDKAKSAK